MEYQIVIRPLNNKGQPLPTAECDKINFTAVTDEEAIARANKYLHKLYKLDDKSCRIEVFQVLENRYQYIDQVQHVGKWRYNF